MNYESTKQKFGIIGDSPAIDSAIGMALQVAKTDVAVLVTGESGVGKEFIPQIIHENSARKHNRYLSVNCGAIPEGTIDSELFGHEKGAFTGATDVRKGYFEEADGGTLFLDEVAELPISTQARLLRVLQTGEFMKVGSSKVQRTNVRVVAATNSDLHMAIAEGKFRKDLYYRLNTVPIVLPPLRERKEDIYKLFRKFAADFSNKYTMPSVRLTPDAIHILEEYRWPGNIRELKSVAERISILETERLINGETLSKYLIAELETKLPAIQDNDSTDYSGNFEFIFKMIGMLKSEIDELKKVVYGGQPAPAAGNQLIAGQPQLAGAIDEPEEVDIEEISTKEIESDKLSIKDKNLELIRKALERHGGNRKLAAGELGISERTLYRKLKELES
ncbi:MAG: sigma-54-dependent Fis family transcriptional regulator [Bacteroidales bacterium]|nr:sigma-54-dependent Fis family transcriptional regulator [Candidatus Equibacterium intestinale]